jgi:hypothetical protein
VARSHLTMNPDDSCCVFRTITERTETIDVREHT